jgi:hypothetical protein
MEISQKNKIMKLKQQFILKKRLNQSKLKMKKRVRRKSNNRLIPNNKLRLTKN